MTDKKKIILRFLGVLIFAVGVVVGMGLFGVVVWGDLEASLFDAAMREDARLTSLRCPVVMTAQEIATVSATLDNPLDRPVEFTVRARISQGHVTLMREIESKLPLDPGEEQKVEWEVMPEDAAFGRLVLVRVRVSPRYPIPARDASCGILVVDFSALSGHQIFTFTLAASLLSLALGAGLWVAASRPLSGTGQDVARAMGALAMSLAVGMVVGLLGSWLFGTIIFVITLLLIGAILGYFVNKI